MLHPDRLKLPTSIEADVRCLAVFPNQKFVDDACHSNYHLRTERWLFA